MGCVSTAAKEFKYFGCPVANSYQRFEGAHWLIFQDKTVQGDAF
jgi:hypothetical protein